MQNPIVKKRTFSLLWIFPIIALAIGLWLAYEHVANSGATIHINFKTGEGITANKTKIRYKDLDVGTVTDVGFSDDLSHVIVKAQMINNATPLLNEQTRFWVVKPQISATGVSGLSTLISGSYIALEPGTEPNAKNKRNFNGLAQAPAIPQSESGELIHLQAANSAGLNIGSPVYYLGLKVGQVTEINYHYDVDRLFISAFIRSPYDKLINTSTKFWNISGISVDVSTSGAKLAMESVESLLLGGITFSTPTNFDTERSHSIKDTVFTLYPSESATDQPPSFNKQYYVLYFDDSIRGLAPNAPVEFNGINIGQVIAVRPLFDQKQHTFLIPVLIEVEPQRIDVVNRTQKDGQNSELFATLVSNGLHASMETDSLITGSKFIKLSMYPEEPGELRQDRYSPYLVMPSRSTGISRITDGVNEIIDKVKKLPLDNIVAKAEDMLGEGSNIMANINHILSAPKMDQLGSNLVTTLDEFNRTMKSIRQVANRTADTLKTVNKELHSVIKQFEETLYGLSPNSSLYYTIQQTLSALRKTADSINSVARKIDAKPNALIFGE